MASIGTLSRVPTKPPTRLLPVTGNHRRRLSSFLPPGPATRPPNAALTSALRYRRKWTLRCSSPSNAVQEDSSVTVDRENSSGFEKWDSTTASFTAGANVPFLLLQLPQIFLNSRNIISGNKSALLAVPWLGMLTGLLGNLSLLSYFVKKKESEAVLVQTLGVVSTYIVIVQLAMVESMPLLQFIATTAVVASGLFINFLNYFSWLEESIWQLWEDFITIGGLSVLPQVMWSTFVPLVPNSILPGLVSCSSAITAIFMARSEKLSKNGIRFVGSLSGWTATLLFMWMPISQMWTNYINPDNIRGLSAFTMFLSLIGNALMIPRALFIRDFMWFTGSTWASILHGWGNLVCMYYFSSISKELFFAATFAFYIWLGYTLWKDAMAYGYSSPLQSLRELVRGSSRTKNQ